MAGIALDPLAPRGDPRYLTTPDPLTRRSNGPGAPVMPSNPYMLTPPSASSTDRPSTVPYPYDPGVDPIYDAWISQSGMQRKKARSDADLAWQRARQQYLDQYGSIDRQADTDRTSLNTAMLSRGVFGSGEQARRGSELETGVLRQRGAADQVFADQFGGISKELADAISSLDAQDLSQGAQARERQEIKKLEEQRAAQQAAATAAAAVPAAAPAPAASAPAPRPAAAPAPTFGPVVPGAASKIGGALKPAKPKPKPTLTKVKGPQ